MKKIDINKDSLSAQTDILKKHLQNSLKGDAFFINNILNSLKVESVNDNFVSIVLSDENDQSVLENYLNKISPSVRELYGDSYDFGTILTDDKMKITKSKEKKIAQLSEIKRSSLRSLNQKNILSNYIILPFNKDIHHSINKIIENDFNYSCLYIYGESSLGKTHAMQAVALNFLESEDKSVIYLQSNFFAHYIAKKLQENNNDVKLEIQEELFDADLLIFDDFQTYFQGDKIQTLNFIFGVIDERINASKVTVFVSDKNIRSLPPMDDRMKTRLLSGLSIELGLPSINEYREIYKFKISKSNLSKYNIDEDAIEYLIRNTTGKFREVEGFINKLDFAVSRLEKNISEITLPFVIENIGIKEVEQKNITPDRIIKIVADYYRLKIGDIKGESRKPELFKARTVAMFMMRDLLKMTLEKIGSYFGRNHATVKNSLSVFEKDLQSVQTKRTYEQLLTNVRKPS
ncbi:hypothetical protein CJJ23_03255 [Mycoplasmopsis agassizii]|uniref:Chromosomal replication initiator protein DnaA n=1 Tax=Mycoplasmopsis agassizii TaxID=33922 RepID=A0A269TI96_9BACT|nr:DnaA/Hda family protein [Mycoplasmopsis agassizii]PAK21202.1 hypothetical protein CJJ23_03255 [Mycoplasmopsis agassizii]